MFLEVIRLGESLATDLAGKRTFAGVSAHVLLEVAGLGERAEADHARVPPLPGVDHHVTAHRSVQAERLRTHVALVRPFAGMAAPVVTHLVQPREMSSTVFTGKRTLTCSTVSVPTPGHTPKPSRLYPSAGHTQT